MRTPTDPMPLRRRDRLRARLGRARRQATVVTGAALLTAGGTALTVGAPMLSDAPNVAAVEAVSAPTSPPQATLLPPAAPAVPVEPVSDRARASSEAGTSIAGGRASYYGKELAGNPTASGEPFDPAGLTAAHRTLPLGTRVRVTYARTGESVVVRINDRGPFHGERVIDLSRAAADAIGLTRAGTGVVELERLPTAGARG